MYVCRTLDYIVNTDLHLYLFVKFDEARSKGVQIDIELTEPIFYLPVNSEQCIEMMDMVLDAAIESLAESTDQKLKFFMFYTCGELHMVIQHSAGKKDSGKKLDKAFKGYKNAHLYVTREENLIRQHLVVK